MQGLRSLQQQCIDGAYPLGHDWQLNHRQKAPACRHRSELVLWRGGWFCLSDYGTRHCAAWTNSKGESLYVSERLFGLRKPLEMVCGKLDTQIRRARLVARTAAHASEIYHSQLSQDPAPKWNLDCYHRF
jgi:hypothetical protein